MPLRGEMATHGCGEEGNLRQLLDAAQNGGL